MFKVIIFDLWSTLAYKKKRKGSTKSLWKETGKKYSYRKMIKTYEKIFQLGSSSNFEEKYKRMLDELKIPYTEELIKRYAFYRRTLESKRYVYKYAVPLLKELKKKGYKIVVLSNTTRAHGSKIMKSELSNYVNKFFFSYDIGSIKPDLKNFKAVLSYFKVKPSGALMIGDSYPDDVVPSRKLGMDAIHFHNGRQLRKELKEMKIL
ncbi:HAD-IA family hydrolase [Candidatus Woesearchaeota archaeon]|nr:HAD-IA family hydrolase [Candidatus Woesearchaeota archaeon]